MFSDFIKGLKKNVVLTNDEIIDNFKCSVQGGMRRSKRTNSLVLISDNTKELYKNEWKDNIIHYTGMGQIGDQDINYSQNKTLNESKNNDQLRIFLFEVNNKINNKNQYIYIGEVELYDEPYLEEQKDKKNEKRKVWKFPLILKKDVDDNIGKILFCNVTWMKKYKGISNNDKLGSSGGSYIEEARDAFEKYNFYNHNGEAYGYVQPSGVIQTREGIDRYLDVNIGIEKLESLATQKVDNVLVVWIATHKAGGRRIVGWYKNATVFREVQSYKNEEINERIYYRMNAEYEDVYLLKESNRVFKIPSASNNISGMGQSNIWYANTPKSKDLIKYRFENKLKREVVDYIDNIRELNDIEKEKLTQTERMIISKIRIGQSRFRDELIKNDNSCRICGLKDEKLLIASHIKPWALSDNKEKLDYNNGLLLCPNHDSLFDKYLISFDNNGNILVSNKLEERSRVLMNVYGDIKIYLKKEEKEYMKHHRKKFMKLNNA